MSEPDPKPDAYRQYLDVWETLVDVVGMTNARQFWNHVSQTPGPTAGCRDKHGLEISSAGRIDYQYRPATTEGTKGDPHPVVKILTIDLASH